MLKPLILSFMLAFHSLSSWAAIEINQASEAELDSLKGIGPALSKRILQARAQGPFTSWNDLTTRVKGIGPATVKRFSEQGLTVNGETHAPATKP